VALVVSADVVVAAVEGGSRFAQATFAIVSVRADDAVVTSRVFRYRLMLAARPRIAGVVSADIIVVAIVHRVVETLPQIVAVIAHGAQVTVIAILPDEAIPTFEHATRLGVATVGGAIVVVVADNRVAGDAPSLHASVPVGALVFVVAKLLQRLVRATARHRLTRVGGAIVVVVAVYRRACCASALGVFGEGLEALRDAVAGIVVDVERGAVGSLAAGAVSEIYSKRKILENRPPAVTIKADFVIATRVAVVAGHAVHFGDIVNATPGFFIATVRSALVFVIAFRCAANAAQADAVRKALCTVRNSSPLNLRDVGLARHARFSRLTEIVYDALLFEDTRQTLDCVGALAVDAFIDGAIEAVVRALTAGVRRVRFRVGLVGLDVCGEVGNCVGRNVKSCVDRHVHGQLRRQVNRQVSEGVDRVLPVRHCNQVQVAGASVYGCGLTGVKCCRIARSPRLRFGEAAGQSDRANQSNETNSHVYPHCHYFQAKILAHA